MEIKTIVVGDLETNCYILEKNNEVLIIDPGAEAKKIIKEVGAKKVVGCLLTHSHFDHVGVLEEICTYYNVKENEYKGSNFSYEVIETKGHTADSVTYYFKDEKIMFCGDFIFYHSIGRTDLGGNDSDMQESLKKISLYDDDIVLYPGHGSKTTLKEEKRRFRFYY